MEISLDVQDRKMLEIAITHTMIQIQRRITLVLKSNQRTSEKVMTLTRHRGQYKAYKVMLTALSSMPAGSLLITGSK